jgi:CRISPR/Cas system-associated exonuclease Cas4 (RecB family)
MRPNVTRPHWSYSSVSQFLKCPLQFYFERVLKLPRKTRTDTLVLGSSLHSALAVYHRKLQVGELVTAQAIHTAYLEAWENQAGDGPIVGSGEKSLSDSRDLGISLVDVYMKAPPAGTIIEVESPMLAPITNSHGQYLEKPLLIVADLITRQEDGSLQVNEIKTSGRAYSESEVATSLQPTFYANAVYELTGEEPAVEFTVLVKTKTPKVQKIQAIRNVTDFQRLGDIIEAVERSIKAESFYPIESPLNCSGCSFYRECKSWSGPGSSSSGEHEVLEIEESAPC